MPHQTERQRTLVELESVLKIAILEEDDDEDYALLFGDLQELDPFEDETDIELYLLINASRFLLPRTHFAKSQDFVKEFFRRLPEEHFRQLTCTSQDGFRFTVHQIQDIQLVSGSQRIETGCLLFFLPFAGVWGVG